MGYLKFQSNNRVHQRYVVNINQKKKKRKKKKKKKKKKKTSSRYMAESHYIF